MDWICWWQKITDSLHINSSSSSELLYWKTNKVGGTRVLFSEKWISLIIKKPTCKLYFYFSSIWFILVLALVLLVFCWEASARTSEPGDHRCSGESCCVGDQWTLCAQKKGGFWSCFWRIYMQASLWCFTIRREISGGQVLYHKPENGRSIRIIWSWCVVNSYLTIVNSF